MTSVVDRRTQSKGKGLTSRQRFIKRNKKHVKRAMDKAISDGNITDIGKGGTDVTVPKDDLREPSIHHGKGGVRDIVAPGNKQFRQGERIDRPQGGGGGGGPGDPSDSGEGEDDFTFHISEDEFLNYLFEDLELPNLLKKGMIDSKKTKPRRAGFASQGPHNKLDLARSKKKKLARVFAAEGSYNNQIIDLLEEEKNILAGYDNDNILEDLEKKKKFKSQKGETKTVKIRKLEGKISRLKDVFNAAVTNEDNNRLQAIENQVDELKGKRQAVPTWNESTDMKFRLHTQEPVPISKAVMFCVMDVSASMDQYAKDNAKVFYFLLHRFLQRHYDQTDIVFIRHTTDASEVDEQDFFYNRETGGTIVSSGLEKMIEIMETRYPENEWNVYGAQASDGDNMGNDNAKCDALMGKILERAQGYFYTEVANSWGGGRDAGLWNTYEGVKAKNPNKFWMGRIDERRDIWPLFREFFKKRDSYANEPAAAAMKANGPQ